MSANYADNMKTFDYGWTKTDKETGPVAQTKDFMQSKKRETNGKALSVTVKKYVLCLIAYHCN